MAYNKIYFPRFWHGCEDVNHFYSFWFMSCLFLGFFIAFVFYVSWFLLALLDFISTNFKMEWIAIICAEDLHCWRWMKALSIDFWTYVVVDNGWKLSIDFELMLLLTTDESFKHWFSDLCCWQWVKALSPHFQWKCVFETTLC